MKEDIIYLLNWINHYAPILGVFVSFLAFAALIWTIILQQKQIKANKADSDRSFAAIDEENFRNQVYQRLAEIHKYRDNCEFSINADTNICAKGIDAIHYAHTFLSDIIDNANNSKFPGLIVQKKYNNQLSDYKFFIESIRKSLSTFEPWLNSLYALMDDIYEKTKNNDAHGKLINLVLNSLQSYEITLLALLHYEYAPYPEEPVKSYQILCATYNDRNQIELPSWMKRIDLEHILITKLFINDITNCHIHEEINRIFDEHKILAEAIENKYKKVDESYLDDTK